MDMNILYRFYEKENGRCIFQFCISALFEADKTVSGVTIIAYEVTKQVHLKDQLIEATMQSIKQKLLKTH
jgi:hypothetical protein